MRIWFCFKRTQIYYQDLKKRKKEKKPRKLFQKRFIRIPFRSNSSTLPSFHSSPEKAKSAANAADSLNPRMRTTFSSGEIAVVNPRRVNSENSKLAAVLEAKWKKKKKKIKRRVGSRLHNDSSVRVVYVCSWEEEMLERIYRQGGWGQLQDKAKGTRMANRGTVHHPNFTLRPRTASRIPYNADPFLRAGFGSYCTVLARERSF